MENLSPEQFYDQLAAHYDEMTRFEQRLPQARTQMQSLREVYNFDSAIDLACGTGLHVCALAQLGVSATGIDISGQMLDKARLHAAKLGLAPRFARSSLLDIDTLGLAPVDAMFCLGNSIPHITEQQQLYFAFAKFAALLNKKGILVLQLLNYRSILSVRERIVNINRSDTEHVIRFYDFVDPLIRFNILRYRWKESKPEHSLQSTLLFPYTLDDLREPLADAGFAKIACFSSLTLGRFDNTSRDLVVIAQK